MNVWMPIIMFESSRELVATAFDISDIAKNDRNIGMEVSRVSAAGVAWASRGCPSGEWFWSLISGPGHRPRTRCFKTREI